MVCADDFAVFVVKPLGLSCTVLILPFWIFVLFERFISLMASLTFAEFSSVRLTFIAEKFDSSFLGVAEKFEMFVYVVACDLRIRCTFISSGASRSIGYPAVHSFRCSDPSVLLLELIGIFLHVLVLALVIVHLLNYHAVYSAILLAI